MLAALTENTLIALIGAIGVVAAAAIPTAVTLRKQNQVHQENRSDHAATAEIVRRMSADLTGVRVDVMDVRMDTAAMKADLVGVKADIADVRTDLSDHAVKLSSLEDSLTKGTVQ